MREPQGASAPPDAVAALSQHLNTCWATQRLPTGLINEALDFQNELGVRVLQQTRIGMRIESARTTALCGMLHSLHIGALGVTDP